MPRIPVDEAPAGPAMDAAVAEALGLTVQWQPWIYETLQPVYLAGTYAVKYDDWAEHEDWRRVLPYSTDIAAAWELAEWATKNLFFHIAWVGGDDGKEWSCTFGTGENRAYAKTASLAICRAFLKANGVEYIEVPE